MTIMTILIVAALLGTVAALVLGVSSMARGGKYDNQHEVQFMGARVGLQGITIILLLIATYLATG